MGVHSMIEFKVEKHEPSLLPEGEWELVWADEFDGTELDRTKWMFRLNFWGERFDAFTDKGVSLDGKSNIVFRPVIVDGRLCSSQIQTGTNSFDYLDLHGAIKNRLERRKGNNPWNQIEIWPMKQMPDNLFLHRYGYYEARMKFQKMPFWWSAFWMQSPIIGITNDPSYCGVENDIIECFTSGNYLTTGNIYGGYGKNFAQSGRVRYPIPNDDEFHRAGMLWTKEGYKFYFDGKLVSESKSPVSNIAQFIVLSTEIHGYRNDQPKTEWTEEELADTFICDYVRVFELKEGK